MNEDKLTEKITDGIQKTVVQIGMMVMLFILFSAATATDPFLRRKFGERYFTRFRCMCSAAAWNTAIGISLYPYRELTHITPKLYLLLGVGNLIFWGYIVRSFFHFRDIRKRQIAGELWHSRSRGVSIFGNENSVRDFLIDVLVVIALAFIFPYAAGFYALSRFLGYMGEVMAMHQLYNRYLDIRDAQIDAEFMEAALRDGFPPNKTAGIYGPLPKRFSGENRANIARVVAGQFTAVPSDLAAGAPRPQAGTSSAPMTGNAGEIARKIFSSTLGSKRFWSVVALLIVVAGLIDGGTALFGWLKSHPKQTTQPNPIAVATTQPIASPISIATQPVSPKPVPVPALPSQPKVQKTSAPPESAKAGENLQPTRTTIAESAQPVSVPPSSSAMDSTTTPEKQAKPVIAATPTITREQWLEKISAALDTNSDAVVQFEHTAKASFSKMRSFRSALSVADDKKCVRLMNELIGKYNQLADEQVAFVNDNQSYRDVLAIDASTNLEDKYQYLTNRLNSLKESRQALLSSMQSASDQIAAAAK